MKNQAKAGIAILVAVLLIAAIGVAVWWIARPETTYSVVLMSNGDVYVGHLTKFPSPTLTDAYQVTRDPSGPSGQENFHLAPFKDALWSPDRAYINPSQILLIAPVGENSRIMQVLKTEEK